jgi:hypothetical protein
MGSADGPASTGGPAAARSSVLRRTCSGAVRSARLLRVLRPVDWKPQVSRSRWRCPGFGMPTHCKAFRVGAMFPGRPEIRQRVHRREQRHDSFGWKVGGVSAAIAPKGTGALTSIGLELRRKLWRLPFGAASAGSAPSRIGASRPYRALTADVLMDRRRRRRRKGNQRARPYGFPSEFGLQHGREAGRRRAPNSSACPPPCPARPNPHPSLPGLADGQERSAALRSTPKGRDP